MVSIVIPTLNSEKTIELCLKSVAVQTYKNIEVIVVDNFSTDKTVEIAKKYTKKVFLHSGERSAQRNSGFKKADGEIYLYLDSDMVLSRSVVHEAVSKFQKKTNCVGLYIPEIVESNSLLARILNFERSFYNETMIDAVRFVRADIFKKIHGFDEDLISGEDWDLDKRIRKFGETEIVSSPLYHLQYGLTFKNYIKKKIYYSKFISRYIDKWSQQDEKVKKQSGFKYRFFDVFFENGKWKRLIKNWRLAILMYLLKIYMGIIYINHHYDNSNYRSSNNF